MPPKRKRRASLVGKGLAPGEQLKRHTLPGNHSAPWAWVGTEITGLSDITLEHVLSTCGFAKRNNHPSCANKYAPNQSISDTHYEQNMEGNADGELTDDIIDIADDELLPCSKKTCKNNPYCLNYLGQEKWEDEDGATEAFMRAAKLGNNPMYDARDPDLPVGLKNLGATCYANASLQVWFRDLAFRIGVYSCQPAEDSEEKFKESPIFQLQTTFAALQESTQNVFNPTKLVESLHLRTTEQQDAQEFSKLFMSHLDAEFKKQLIPGVKSLITDQFQGKQVYGTICDKCHYQSERDADFLEIEINFESNSKLEDRIAALLQPETLSGDNKYLCSRCDSLQDATRYTELRKLPPVLHFSLLRFVYDISTMERKKSKHVISFPLTLNMRRFLGSTSTRESACIRKTDEDIYELRGILLHKGVSAYHGHYEAQVYDAANESWFQFNDEVVTKIGTLGDKKRVVIDSQENNETPSQGRKHRATARKRRRVDDSEDEVVGFDPSSNLPKGSISDRSKDITSKDAYMLIYALKDGGRQEPQVPSTVWTSSTRTPPVPTPPPRALELVYSLNVAHDESCDDYAKREKKLREGFKQRRRKVTDIYGAWNVSSADESAVVVSQQALEVWLSKYAKECDQDGVQSTPSTPSSGATQVTTISSPLHISIDDILCPHRRLDHKKAGSMKLISQRTYNSIIDETSCSFYPKLSPGDICNNCVQLTFRERLYQIEHPRIVHRFDQISEVAIDCIGYWISKQWLKDWRLVKPKMHVVSEDDPPPDAPGYEVCCEHGGLSLHIANRRRISAEAAELLQSVFPSWAPISTDAELCPTCDALIHISKEDKREIRKRAEDEKAKLKHMYDNALNSDMSSLQNVPCAIIPAQFVKNWRQWLSRPSEVLRPDMVDNTLLICEHGLLALDPNSPTDLNSSLAIIKRSDWEILENLYPGGPLIAIEKRPPDDDEERAVFVHDVPVCAVCHQRRKSDWTTTDITVRLCGSHEAINTDVPSQKHMVIYSRKGARQSKRLRQVKEFEEKISVSKTTTVKEIKLILQEELNIPTIYQRLFLRGEEIDDNAATVASLQIYANDILDLQEDEIQDVASDSDDLPAKKERRDEGRGFGGTLLGRVEHPSRREQTPPFASGVGKPCLACTFTNTYDALACVICDTLFARI